MLHQFIEANREAILARARTMVATRRWPTASTEELVTGSPLFLTQLIGSLRKADAMTTKDDGAIGPSATLHGGQLLSMGYSISQVVHLYGDVCQ